ncbi:MAG: AAA family ATPase [Nitrososphaerota archaeon]|nr:AAA family ATPase [Candidatus Bathyarchaeota archaeon]MDW8023633.1 AAA family ATPase [Nitrososphaerota archaeon]
MPLFDDRPGGIFRDARWLQPLSPPPSGKPLCRDNDLRFMASFLSELFKTGQARNLFIFGKPGTGKTVCVQYLIEEVEKHAEEKGFPVFTVYVNAGRTRTPYYTMLEVVRGLGLNVPDVGWQMFRLKQAFEKLLMDKSVVIAIDEVDSILQKEKEPIIYYLNRQPKTTLILISNKIEDATQIPERALSTLQPKLIPLDPYTKEETKEILQDRVKHAFHPSVLPDYLLDKVAEITSELGDIRLGFSILLSAGYSAERAGRAGITDEDIKSAIKSEETTEILKAIGEMREKFEKRRKRGR